MDINRSTAKALALGPLLLVAAMAYAAQYGLRGVGLLISPIALAMVVGMLAAAVVSLPKPMGKDFATTEEVSEVAGVNRASLYEWVREGLLPALVIMVESRSDSLTAPKSTSESLPAANRKFFGEMSRCSTGGTRVCR